MLFTMGIIETISVILVLCVAHGHGKVTSDQPTKLFKDGE